MAEDTWTFRAIFEWQKKFYLFYLIVLELLFS